ncbi:SDR family oxidoreductase [Paraburkholderia dipogonis]|uniref:SDR family oxidoreductase n=1 Tax=Paraburkholderia dipogonis TaxID=1211383 RepID=A0A4Y8MGB8_9BURK|nr:SDR family NAD(P)-dependent oxidoreductase [Paraburkholderia dipogonis]TFE36502.1 SDR family oxidoreductase [Paraburkholderia dipogonis]
MSRLAGKVAIITGAGGGQGAEEARLFAAEGAAIAVCDVAFEQAEAVAESINANGGKARAYDLDVCDAAGWCHTVEDVNSWAGNVTVLVNNAGIILRTGVMDTDEEKWQHLLNINLTGAFLGTKAVVPSMRAAGGGAIVNISSIAGLSGYYDAAYSASKWGLRGLTKTSALEFAKDAIRVNAVCPGVIVTPLNENATHLEPFRRMTPLGRHGTLSEAARLVLFLASDDSSYITGEEIALDGGLNAGAALHRVIEEANALAK